MSLIQNKVIVNNFIPEIFKLHSNYSPLNDESHPSLKVRNLLPLLKIPRTFIYLNVMKPS